MPSYSYNAETTKRLSELKLLTDDHNELPGKSAKRHARRNLNRADRNATRRALRDMRLTGWEEE